MTGGPVLVAVHDSAAAFAAVDCAIRLAQRLGTSIHAVEVIEDIPVTKATTEDGALGRFASRARRAGVPFQSSARRGAVAPAILDAARESGADWIVMARVDRPGHTIPGIGSRTMRVLEFAEVPVIVVPDSQQPGSLDHPSTASESLDA